MPFLQKKILAFDNHRLDASQIGWLDAFATPQPDGREPELSFAVPGVDVNVRRLGAFVRIEVEAPAEKS